MAAYLPDFVKSYLCCCLPLGGAKSSNPLVTFSQYRGTNVQLANFVVGGRGVAFANSPLIQTRAYFEITVLEKGEFYIGVARRDRKNLDGHLCDRKKAWGLYSGPGGGDYVPGDVIGVTFDLSEGKPALHFYKNGKLLKLKKSKGIKGEVYPAVSVSGGCLLQANFGHAEFQCGPPDDRFEPVIFSRDLLS